MKRKCRSASFCKSDTLSVRYRTGMDGHVEKVGMHNVVAQKRSGKPKKSWGEVLLDDIY